MNNTLTYKGFVARVEFSAEDSAFIGRIAGINDIIGFHAESVPELTSAFHEAVDDYIETCAKAGKDPQKPYSGRMMFRVDPEIHAKAARAAALAGKNLNQWAAEVLSEAAMEDA